LGVTSTFSSECRLLVRLPLSHPRQFSADIIDGPFANFHPCFMFFRFDSVESILGGQMLLPPFSFLDFMRQLEHLARCFFVMVLE
jgi:hypothetical protein